ncbi:hypothetical protein EF834_08365 [Rhodococcus spongiicola]|uniref:Secreted protein n=2 Tax=Rhodococcus spongiicola TaxID=2487352 RepID=A0A3S3AL17_9NOCA|nr:hypothetical protein EF834_08365 [Rhodococcus spongiicola]
MKKLAAGVAASAAMIGTVAVATPATASAQSMGSSSLGSGEDTGYVFGFDMGSLGVWDTDSLGVLDTAPKMEATVKDGKVTVQVVPPEDFRGTCSPTLFRVDDLAELMMESGSVSGSLEGDREVFIPYILRKNTWESVGKVEDGVYALVGECTGLPLTELAVQVLVVPGGIGSVGPYLELGSTSAVGSITGSLGSLAGDGSSSS